MPRQILLCVLGLCLACGGAEQAMNQDGDPTSTSPHDAGNSSAFQDGGRARDDAGATPLEPHDASVGLANDAAPPDDPPLPTAACGTDLDVHNGTVSPDFGELGSPRVFVGDPRENGPYQVQTSDHTLANPDPQRADY